MEFPNLETVQSFLARWLEQHGHDVYCQVPVPSGKKVDILTQDYLVRCAHTLTPATIQGAADDLKVQRGHFPDQKPVIAGLTPDQQCDAAYDLAEKLKGSAIEVWFIDQMPPFVSYYRDLTNQGEPVKESPLRRAPWAGCFLSVGVAAILGFSFWAAFGILERYQLQEATNTQDSRTWEQLHGAVAAWDVNGATAALDQLATSRNACAAKFATRFADTLAQQGAEGFRDINPIMRTLNEQEDCRLDIQEYEFSP